MGGGGLTQANGRNSFFIQRQDNPWPAAGLPVACDFLSVACGGDGCFLRYCTQIPPSFQL
jgi:hypothetical protein